MCINRCNIKSIREILGKESSIRDLLISQDERNLEPNSSSPQTESLPTWTTKTVKTKRSE
jgi:hypothetical protein